MRVKAKGRSPAEVRDIVGIGGGYQENIQSPLDTCQHHVTIARMSRPRHPNKHIEQAIRCAEQLGWTVEMSSGHAWGRLLCPHHFRDGCKVTVNFDP